MCVYDRIVNLNAVKKGIQIFSKNVFLKYFSKFLFILHSGKFLSYILSLIVTVLNLLGSVSECWWKTMG